MIAAIMTAVVPELDSRAVADLKRVDPLPRDWLAAMTSSCPARLKDIGVMVDSPGSLLCLEKPFLVAQTERGGMAMPTELDQPISSRLPPELVVQADFSTD
jgi:hypothetical protein